MEVGFLQRLAIEVFKTLKSLIPDLIHTYHGFPYQGIMGGSCIIFILISYLFDTKVMLILILIDVQYSQYAVFSFEKDSNRQNHSPSGSQHPVKISSPAKFLVPSTGGIYPSLLTTVSKTLHIPRKIHTLLGENMTQLSIWQQLQHSAKRA